MDTDSQTAILLLMPALLLLCLLLPITAFGAERRIAPAPGNFIEAFVDVTGLLRGKQHRLRFNRYSGTVKDEASVELLIETASAVDLDEWLSAKDQGKVLEHTLSRAVLDAAKFPEIRFRSLKVTKTVTGYAVDGTLTIRGITKPASVQIDSRGLSDFEGTSTFSMTGFGIQPPKAALGAIGTKDAMTIRFKLHL